MIEYGIAFNSIGNECIIGVLNKDYGSPNDNDDNIPFDIRHLRFPIEYQYKKKNESFVVDLKNSIKACVYTAIENRKNKFLPFISWYEYRNSFSNKFDFYENDKTASISSIIRNSKKDIRFLGLSGLGKTRITFESFKKDDENIQFNWLYCDYQLYDESKIIEVLNKIFDNIENLYTIVIDNCPLDFLRKVLKSKYEKDNSSKIISIYNQPDKEYNDTINKIDYIHLNIKDLESIVDKIIENQFSDFNEHQRNTIKQFSEGIPLMAVLLAENVNSGNENVGLLSDKELLNNLLYIESETEKEILKSCSLFKYIGFSDDAKEQINYIVTNPNITPISGDDAFKLACFEKVFFKYKKREIFEINGRYFGIRPRPLAFYLAEEWIDQCLEGRLERIISDFTNPNNTIGKSLIEPLCQQISFLGYNSKAQAIILALTVPDAPFHNAEVINTELGSRLFRSFVEVNPVAVANCLWSVFGNMTTEQIHQIEEGRRNLVWTLEKLCFDARTYEQGMKLMLMFGVAENETWGNNATNEFVHLFKIYLPGTQASLSERLEVLRWGINHTQYKELSLKAVASALEASHFTYMSGAENQGTKQLEHYQPKLWEEVFDYWTACIDIISNEILNNTDYSEFCCKTLVHRISGLCNSKAASIVLPAVKEICNKKNNDWDDMLDSLMWIKSHISSKLEKTWQTLIDEMIEALTKKDFVSRFKAINNRHFYLEENLNYEERTKKQQEKCEVFAREYVENEFNDISTLLKLYQIDCVFSHPFGYTIAKLIEHSPDKLQWFINASIECFHSLEKYNPSILFDFSRGLDDEAFDYLVTSLEKDDMCSYLLFPILANHGITLPNTQLLFELVNKRTVPVKSFLDFWRYSTILQSSSNEEIIDFFSKIIISDKNGFNVVIAMLKNLLFFNNNRRFDTIADFIIHEFKNRDIVASDFLLNNDYLEVIKMLLEKCHKPELAVYINSIIIELSKNPNAHISSDWRIEHIYEVLLDKYFANIAQDLLSAIISDNPFSTLSFRFLFQPKEYSDLSHILFKKEKSDMILDFCKQSSIAQERIISIVPAIQDGDFSPFVMELLNNFGSNTAMLRGLSSNIGTFSCVGSLIPLYESKKKTISTLLNHSNPTVADWAQRQLIELDRDIAREQQKETEEKFLYS